MMRKIKHILPLLALALSLLASAQAMPDYSSRSACLATLQWAEQHLADPADTAHNEALYLQVLQQLVASVKLSADDKLRPQLLLDDALKNAPGTVATDFSYVTPNGNNHSLSEQDSTATLIYFNDPDCEACAKVKARLDTCAALRELVTAGKLRILAIYPYGDGDLWKATPYPEYLINGWNQDQSIDEQQTYVLPSMPLFYLLDKDNKVVLKNEASLNRTLNAVQALIVQE